MKEQLLNHAAVKRYILTQMQQRRPGVGFTRVSKSVLLQLEARLRDVLDRAIWQHRSTGKTFTDIC